MVAKHGREKKSTGDVGGGKTLVRPLSLGTIHQAMPVKPVKRTREWIVAKLDESRAVSKAKRVELEKYEDDILKAENKLLWYKKRLLETKANKRKLLSEIKREETKTTLLQLKPPKDMVDCMGKAGGSMFGSLPAELILMIMMIVGYEDGWFKKRLYLVSKMFHSTMCSPGVIKHYNEWKINYCFGKCNRYSRMLKLRWTCHIDFDKDLIPKYPQLDYGAVLPKPLGLSIELDGTLFNMYGHQHITGPAVRHPIYKHLWFVKLLGLHVLLINTKTKRIHTCEWLCVQHVSKTETAVLFYWHPKNNPQTLSCISF
jgi:hypothetical protein